MATSTSSAGWRQRSSGFLAGIAAIVLVVVLLGGMAIGYEIEKSRVKTTKTTKTTPNQTATNRQARVVGTVSVTSAKTISIKPAKGGTDRKVALTKKTVVVKAGSGAASDIAPNVRVVFSGAGSFSKAKAVIVLPSTAHLGSMVTSADGSTMSLKNGTKTMKITTTGATVDKVTPAKITDVVKGSKVMVATVRTKAGVVVATEIILLAANSPFQ
ncbi:MAG: hypothetical protein M3Q30_10775 [Actinomycetota bacterium]|nr:hypothetical protein [Actinomycetota bacterium]